MAERTQESERIFTELEPLLAGAGLALVDCVVSRHRGSVHVRVVIYSPSGTGTNECSAAHRMIHPRLQVLLDTQEPSLEVSSPGIDRILRNAREWRIFTGKAIRYLDREGIWKNGTISAVEGEAVTLSCDGGKQCTVPLAEIIKARLDSSREGE